MRYQLKARGIHLSWDGLRQELDGQDQVTIEMKRADGKSLHIRKATWPESRQQVVYDALEIPHHPGKTIIRNTPATQPCSAITALSGELSI